VEPALVADSKVLQITLEDIEEEVAFWQPALVGYIVSPMPKLSTLQAFIDESRGWLVDLSYCAILQVGLFFA